MSNKSMNRAIGRTGARLRDQFIAKARYLSNHSRHQFTDCRLHGLGTLEAEPYRTRSHAQQHDRFRITADQPRGIERISNPDVVHRSSLAYRIPDRLAVQVHQRAGRLTGIYRIGQDDMHALRKLTEQRQAQRATFDQAHAGGYPIITLDSPETDRAESVIAEQHFAEPQDKHRHTDLRSGLRTAHRHGWFDVLCGTILKPENIESKIPLLCDTEDQRSNRVVCNETGCSPSDRAVHPRIPQSCRKDSGNPVLAPIFMNV